MKDVSNQEGTVGFDRRAFVKRAGLASVGVAGLAFLSDLPAAAKMSSVADLLRDVDDDRTADTAQQIFTAALIAREREGIES